mgnify:CR=1 FL=1
MKNHLNKRNEMINKRLMESWGYIDKKLDESDLEPCPTQPVLVGDFKDALKLSLKDKSVQKSEIEKLTAGGKSAARLQKIVTIAGLVAATPAVGAIGGLSLAAGLLGMLASAIKSKQEGKQDKNISQMLAILCIDDDLLDILDNRIEKQYWQQSDLRAQVESYANSASDNEPMPNFTRHFVDWLNTESVYSKDSLSTPNTNLIVKKTR